MIDAGGQDIIVTPSVMADFEQVTLANLNKTNGATTTVEFTVKLLNPIFKGDVLHLELAPDLSFSEEVTCEPGNALVTQLSCSNSERFLLVDFIEVDESAIGEFKFSVRGIRNPPSTRPSQPFVQLYTVDKNGFKSQTVTEAQRQLLVLQTEEPAII